MKCSGTGCATLESFLPVSKIRVLVGPATYIASLNISLLSAPVNRLACRLLHNLSQPLCIQSSCTEATP
jgi:hypothetical protein